jgi:hypothetical protein
MADSMRDYKLGSSQLVQRLDSRSVSQISRRSELGSEPRRTGNVMALWDTPVRIGSASLQSGSGCGVKNLDCCVFVACVNLPPRDTHLVTGVIEVKTSYANAASKPMSTVRNSVHRNFWPEDGSCCGELGIALSQ